MKSRLLVSLLLTACALFAADPAPTPAADAATPAVDPVAVQLAARQKIVDGLTYRQGETIIGDKLAKITIPEQFRFLDAKDTSVVLTDLWGNPKSSHALGALVPTGFNPLGGDISWLVVITYDDDGYVKDDDAAKIDYTKMLAEMQESTREGSKERVKAGYGAVELVGWAKPPRYDATAHKLYWAKELKFGTDGENTLNYNIRMLGRGGVLVLNAVASMSELPQVEAATPTLLGMVNFMEGQRYADFNADTDKTATYGLAALVAGGVAAKAGLFKGLWIGILAFKKVIIIGLIAFAGSFKKIYDWVRGRNAANAAAEPPKTS